MTQVVSWSGEWSIETKNGDSIKVCTIVVASRHGIMRADFKAAADGSLDMQSEYQPGTWLGKAPGHTTSQKLWEHAFVTAIHNRCDKVHQHDLATADAMFEYFALEEQVNAPSQAAPELWRNWHEMMTGSLDEPEPYSGRKITGIWVDELGAKHYPGDGFTDLLTTPMPCPYLGDSRYGIY